MKGYRRKKAGLGPVGPAELLVESEDRERPDWHSLTAGNHVTGAVIMAVAAVASGVMSYKASATAAKQQKNIAEANAQRIAAEKAEQLRKMQLDQDRTLSQARAAAAASGVSVEGTQKTYIEQMRESFKAEQDWLRSASTSQQAITRAEGSMQAGITRAQGTAALVGSIGRAGGSFAGF